MSEERCPSCARKPGSAPRGVSATGRCTNCGGTGVVRVPSVVERARAAAVLDVRGWMYAEQTTLHAVIPAITESEAADAVARAMLDTAVVRLRALGMPLPDIAKLAAESYARRAGIIR